jgi:magnesium chelatase accessory protein
MARWDLRPLAHDLARLQTPLTLIVGSNDRAVPPGDAVRVRRMVSAAASCSIETLHGAGHLVHEERAGEVAKVLLAAVRGAACASAGPARSA